MRHLRTNPPAHCLSTIAYLDTFQTRDEWKLYPTTRKLWKGASERADQLGYKLERFWSYEPGITPDRLRGILLARGIHGIIVKFNPPKHNLLHGLLFGFGPLAVTTVEFRMSQPPVHSATNDQFQSTLLGLNKLHELGCRRIGLVVSAYDNNAVDYRIIAANLVCQQRINADQRVPMPSLPENKWTSESFAS